MLAVGVDHEHYRYVVHECPRRYGSRWWPTSRNAGDQRRGLLRSPRAPRREPRMIHAAGWSSRTPPRYRGPEPASSPSGDGRGITPHANGPICTLAHEVIDNSVDEAIAGYCKQIDSPSSGRIVAGGG